MSIDWFLGLLVWFFQIILGLLGLSLLVFVHELGHFLAAKFCGVRVLAFSIGFGKKLLKFTKNGTVYCISAIPFGGYVSMAGENPENVRENKPDDFHVQPIRKRALIAFAGPAFNVIFAYFLLTGFYYMIGNPERIYDKLVIGIVEPESAAEEAGIAGGDTIFSIDGEKAKSWDRLREEMAISIGRSIPLEVGTKDGRKTIAVVPRELGELGIGTAGIHPRHRVFVAADPSDSPAGKAGIKQNDTILSVNGRFIGYFQDMITIISASEGKEVEVVFLRASEENKIDTLSAIITPFYSEENKRYLIGIQMGVAQFDELQVVSQPLPLGTALAIAAERSYIMGTAVFRYINRIFKGEVKLKAMSGPVGIVQVIGLVWLEDLQKAVFLLALISINLGVMNLLPLAITDGGVLLFLLIEKLRGKPISQKNQTRIQQVALAFFITLFVYVTFIDLSRGSMLMK